MSPPAEPAPEPPAGAFPSTRWSRVLGARDDAPERQRDLELLARAYLLPIRRWFAHAPRPPGSEPDALAQDFFVWMLESGFLERADPARGRFRGYLKTALRHFVVDQDRRRRAHKRGGGQAPVPLDHEAARELAAPGPAPDEALDAAWREELLQRALAELERELDGAGRGVTFRVFADYFLAPGGELDYAAVAARHGLTATMVSNHLMHAKRRFRALLQAAVAETVGAPADLEAELAWLFAGVKDAGGAR